MQSSYLAEDVTILLKDITGQLEPTDTKTREKLIQSGTHYSEMLPLEYVPSPPYFAAYQNALEQSTEQCARAAATVAEQILRDKGKDVVLVSLARAGTSIGVLIKRWIQFRYQINVPHYTISIIRGRGIDRNAMRHLLEQYSPKQIQFVDGWTGKGAIDNTLRKEMAAYPGIDPMLAVLSDPARITDFCGTHDDFLIPSACLNSTISGLMSRTVLRDDLIGADDFHGAVYYGEMKDADQTYGFIDRVCAAFGQIQPEEIPARTAEEAGAGLREVQKIAKEFGISDINLVKPSIGEATRVLLRRVPWKLLIRADRMESEVTAHMRQLAKEKGVEVVPYPLENYTACGIIKEMQDV